MKGMKKLLSILMVLTLVLSLSATAFADLGMPQGTEGKVTVTLPAEYKGHTMVAYQIFKGAQNEDSKQNQLGVTGWADGVDSTGLLKALTEDEKYSGFSEDMNDVAAAKAIGELGLSGTEAYEFATLVAKYVSGSGVPFNDEGDQPTADLSSGYWIIIDETAKEGQPTGFAYSAYLLQVVGNEGKIPVKPKFDAPKIDKQVADQNDSETENQTWGEVADWDIDDDVPFRLEATMPGELVGYSSYKLVFHDTLSDGLTLNADSIKVFVGEQEITKEAGGWKVIPDPEDCSFEVEIDNVLAAPYSATTGSKITVTYTAKLNEGAVIGGTGNPNEVYLEYSNNPNAEGTGKTTTDRVVVFTFELDVNKVKAGAEGGPNDPLTGAVFTLQKKNDAGVWEDIETIGYTKDTTEPDGTTTKFKFKGLDEGQYKIVETVVPAGYNKADDIEFTVTATYTDPEGNESTVETLNITGDGSFATATDTGIISTDVLNSTGVELPETGGIGTTIFYVAGAILVAGALVLLVTKKRVNGAEK